MNPQIDDEFRGIVREAEDRMVSEIARRCLRLGVKAISALEAVVDHPATPGAHAKIRAATGLLDALARFREFAVLEERITRLETASAQDGGGNARFN